MKSLPLREQYRSTLQVRGYSEGTVKGYVNVVSMLVSRTGVSCPGRLSNRDVTTYLSSLLTDFHYAPDTYGVHVAALRHFFEWIVHRQMPVLEVAKRQHRETLPVVLTYPQTQRLFQHILVPRLHAAAMTIYGCGLRISELRGLQTDWIMGDRGLVHIHDAKGGMDRVVPMPGKVLELLRAHWRREQPCGKRIFQSASGRMLAGATLSKALKAAAREAGISREPHPHMLRHCYATHLLERGVSLPLIQRWLGHKHIKTTAIYAQITPELQEKGRAALDEMIAQL